MAGGGDCDWDGEGSGTGPLAIDYVQAYHCGFQEQGWLFYPFLLGWGCFITYLSASCGWSIEETCDECLPNVPMFDHSDHTANPHPLTRIPQWGTRPTPTSPRRLRRSAIR